MLVTVPSGQVVWFHAAPLRSALVRFALERFAQLTFACVRFARVRLPLKLPDSSPRLPRNRRKASLTVLSTFALALMKEPKPQFQVQGLRSYRHATFVGAIDVIDDVSFDCHSTASFVDVDVGAVGATLQYGLMRRPIKTSFIRSAN